MFGIKHNDDTEEKSFCQRKLNIPTIFLRLQTPIFVLRKVSGENIKWNKSAQCINQQFLRQFSGKVPIIIPGIRKEKGLVIGGYGKLW